MRKTTETTNCNCIWKYCPSHPNGALCNEEAYGFDCGHCKETHWLGDQIIGPGIRLCSTCARHLLNFFCVELPGFMHDIAPYVPYQMSHLEALVRHYYLSRIDMVQKANDNNADHSAWETLISDGVALMEFVYLVGPKVPAKLLSKALAFTEMLLDLRNGAREFDLVEDK